MANETALQQATNRPLDTDEQLRDFAAALLDRAVRRQCWLMFFTARRSPVELLIPIDDLPHEPDDNVDDFASVVSGVVERCGATEVVVAWERVGAAELEPSEQLWVAAIADAFHAASVRVRAQLVVHDDGVALVDVEAARAAAAGAAAAGAAAAGAAGAGAAAAGGAADSATPGRSAPAPTAAAAAAVLTPEPRGDDPLRRDDALVPAAGGAA